MSCTSPYTVPKTNFPLLEPSSFSRYFSSSATAAFMHSADFRTNGRMSSPAPNLSPTSFIAGSRSSFKVDIAAACVASFGALIDIFPPSSDVTPFCGILSAMADTTSFSIPSRSLLTILKLARLPAGQLGSTSAFFVMVDWVPILSKCDITSASAFW